MRFLELRNRHDVAESIGAEAQRPDRTKARRVQKLLDRPDRLIGVILIGNNFVNILASAIATVLLPVGSEAGIAAATLTLTLVVLIFAESHRKRSPFYTPKGCLSSQLGTDTLLRLLYPWFEPSNLISNSILKYLAWTRKTVRPKAYPKTSSNRRLGSNPGSPAGAW